MRNLFYDKEYLDAVTPSYKKRLLRQWKEELWACVGASVDFLKTVNLGNCELTEAVRACQKQAELEIDLINKELEALDDTI